MEAPVLVGYSILGIEQEPLSRRPRNLLEDAHSVTGFARTQPFIDAGAILAAAVDFGTSHQEDHRSYVAAPRHPFLGLQGPGTNSIIASQACRRHGAVKTLRRPLEEEPRTSRDQFAERAGQRYDQRTACRKDVTPLSGEPRNMARFDYSDEAELYPSRSKGMRRQPLGYKRFASAAAALQFAIEVLSPSLLAGAWLEVGEERFDASDMRSLYESADYPLKRGEPAREPEASGAKSFAGSRSNS